MYESLASFINRKFNVDAHYFLKGGFWLGATQAITILGGLLTSVLFAHYLAPQEFGTYRYLIGLATLFAAFSLTGLGQSILQASAKGYDGFYNETIKENILYSLPISLTGIIGSIYYFINENKLLGVSCIIIAILQPLINIFSNTSSLLQGQKRYKESTILQLIKVSFVTAVSTIAIFLTSNILILLISFLLSNVFINFFGHFLYKPINTSKTPEATHKTYKSYAVHTSLRNVVANLANRADTLVVFTQLGAVELAIYTIATIIPEQVKGALKNFSNLLLPKYAKNDNTELLKKAVLKKSIPLFLILSSLTVVYILVSPLIYQILFPKYPEAVILNQIAALAFPSLILFVPYSIIQSRLAENVLYSLQITTSILQIALTITLTVWFGLYGAIIARIIYRYIFMIFAFYEVKKL